MTDDTHTIASCRLTAVIFDMDGLLADTESLSFRALSAMLADDFGITPTAEDAAWATVTVGKHGLEVWELNQAHFHLPITLPNDMAALNRSWRVHYDALLAQGVMPMPGAVDLVRACRATRLRVGVASSSSMAHIEVVLTSIGILDQFDTLTSGHEVPRSKPDPAIYRLACERLGVEPARAVAIEDSGPGVLAAADAGLRCLAVPSNYTANHDFSRASATVPTLVGVTPADLAALR
jgi:HAD superfamily hydrolase (TIGR01509 family)